MVARWDTSRTRLGILCGWMIPQKAVLNWKGPYFIRERLGMMRLVSPTGSPIRYRRNLLFRFVHYDRLRRYSLPVVFPMEGPPVVQPPPSPVSGSQGNSAATNGSEGTSLFAADQGSGLDLVSIPSSLPVQVPGQSVFSKVGRSVQRPARFGDITVNPCGQGVCHSVKPVGTHTQISSGQCKKFNLFSPRLTQFSLNGRQTQFEHFPKTLPCRRSSLKKNLSVYKSR